MTRSPMVLLVLIGALSAGNAQAVPPGKTAEWDASNGKVIFDGKVHSDKGLKCLDCHSKIFKMKKGSTEMKMADINAGKYCGECHNGARSFTTNDPANCVRCHKK
ncbi:MAG: cytochrome c3 family protein [Desulfuromonadales bacterium]|nr:cytochrome c3 family protein [Desulfuromonadales bacterium]